MPPAPTGPGGLDLAALAQQGTAENMTRIAGQGDLIAAYLNALVRENEAENTANAEVQSRFQNFAGAQSAIDRDMQQRLADLRDQDVRYEVNSESSVAAADRAAAVARAQQSASSRPAEPNPYEWAEFQAQLQAKYGKMEREQEWSDFQRQARFQHQLQQEADAEALALAEPSLADYGEHSIDPNRGRLLLEATNNGQGAVRGVSGSAHVAQMMREQNEWLDAATDRLEHNYADPAAVIAQLRDLFRDRGYGSYSDEAASVALHLLGYYPAG